LLLLFSFHSLGAVDCRDIQARRRKADHALVAIDVD
jgi:hypothetical protein